MASVWYLVVAGGGGGGTVNDRAEGGGGGGGVLSNNAFDFAVSQQAYSIVVGAGGNANANGQDSTFSTITATGGGKGKDASGLGGNGGSGGGVDHSSTGSAGTGIAGQGNNGGGVGFNSGDGVNGAFGAAGGGGAGAVGGNGVGTSTTGHAGNGGAGISNSITGSAVVYGGGGGGGAQALGTSNGLYTRGAGGSGGGGNGGYNSAGVAGTANTGGGGGGGGGSGGQAGGKGGSGVVIIRYHTADLSATGGTITTVGADTVHTFTGNGTFTVLGAPVADFSGTPLSGTAPLSVAFTDSSTNTPTSWLWEKNNGSGWVAFTSGSTSQNPTESFTAGTWSVRLTATNAGGSDTKTITDYIMASAIATGAQPTTPPDSGGGQGSREQWLRMRPALMMQRQTVQLKQLLELVMPLIATQPTEKIFYPSRPQMRTKGD